MTASSIKHFLQKGIVASITAITLGVATTVALPPQQTIAYGLGCYDYTYRRGGNGECVRQIQRIINALALGSSIAEDGSFGPATQSKVRSFQSSESITVDGIVGPNTWLRLCAPRWTGIDNTAKLTDAGKKAGCPRYY